MCRHSENIYWQIEIDRWMFGHCIIFLCSTFYSKLRVIFSMNPSQAQQRKCPHKNKNMFRYSLLTVWCWGSILHIWHTGSPSVLVVCSVLISGAVDGSRLLWSHLSLLSSRHTHTQHIRPSSDWFWLSGDLEKGRWMGNQFGLTCNFKLNHVYQCLF